MKLLLINSVCGITSTGRIVKDIYEAFVKEGNSAKIAYGERSYDNDETDLEIIPIGSKADNYFHAIMTRITDKHGLFSIMATKRFIKKLDEYKPDIVHIHNLHGYYINYELLFKYLKEHENIRVVWTLHDCWSFTGHCANFTEQKCDKWKEKCYDCPLKKTYPASLLWDNSSNNYFRKKKAFTGVKDMTVVVPSKWLESFVFESFLKDYPVKVINNGVDVTGFYPTTSDFKAQYGIEGRKIILGVANVWVPNKGLDYFVELANIYKEKGLDDYRIVIVGRIPRDDFELPDNMIYVAHTDSKVELNHIYNAADVLVSFSSEETFGMTVVEAMAAGTYPVVMKNTACEEIVDMTIGTAVDRDALEVFKCLEGIFSSEKNSLSREEIHNHAAKFSREEYMKKLFEIYKKQD